MVSVGYMIFVSLVWDLYRKASRSPKCMLVQRETMFKSIEVDSPPFKSDLFSAQIGLLLTAPQGLKRKRNTVSKKSPIWVDSVHLLSIYSISPSLMVKLVLWIGNVGSVWDSKGTPVSNNPFHKEKSQESKPQVLRS